MKLKCKISHTLRREILAALPPEERFIDAETGVITVYGDYLFPLSVELIGDQTIAPEEDLLVLVEP